MPTDFHVETSVFIQRQNSEPARGSVNSRPSVVSGRPLLASSTSSNNTQHTTRLTRWRLKYCVPSRAFLLTIFVMVILILIAAVFLVAFLFAPNETYQTPHYCHREEQYLLRTHAFTHLKCSRQLKIIEDCQSLTEGAWGVFSLKSNDWEKVHHLIPSAKKDVAAIAVSPLYVNNHTDICSLRISFDFKSDSPLQVFIHSFEDNTNIALNVTSNSCHHGLVQDNKILSNLVKFRVVILSSSLISANRVTGSVTTHACYEFKNIDHFPVVKAAPQFTTVPRGTRNLCSSEIIDQIVQCDWWRVLGVGNAEFARHDTHACLHEGVTYQKDDGYSQYLSLNGTYPNTTGYLISPIIEGGAPNLLLSFWYIAQCSGSKIRIYVIPSSRDINVMKANNFLHYEVTPNSTSNKWEFQSFVIPIPADYKRLQVVIEGSVSSQGSCRGHRCHLAGDRFAEPLYPQLAIDEIALKDGFEQCNVTNSSAVDYIDCAFQDANNSSTTCSWRSSTTAYAIGILKFFETHWDTDDAGDDMETTYGATSEHLKGRGTILSFDATGNSRIHAYFRSPLLVANSNCSCSMSFLYLLRGIIVPRLQVNLVLGDDTNDDKRPIVPQWSEYGHQGDNWRLATLLLNIETSTPFQVEIRVREVHESRGDVHVDDLLFRNCDFHLFKSS